jgi:periplasmic protein TonB
MTIARRRLGAALGASAVLHAVALAVLLHTAIAPLEPARLVLPIALIGPRSGGGAGGPAAASEPPAPADTTPLAPVPHPSRPRVVRPVPSTPAHRPAPARADDGATGTASGDGGRAGGTGGRGGGDGSGGDGAGGTAVAYDANPLPPYPVVARRLGKEGVVVLEVLVAEDGHAADVRVLQSSGFAPLDESAATTVRERWRFVPAHRGGAAVAVRVTVPIRFRLQSAQG